MTTTDETLIPNSAKSSIPPPLPTTTGIRSQMDSSSPVHKDGKDKHHSNDSMSDNEFAIPRSESAIPSSESTTRSKRKDIAAISDGSSGGSPLAKRTKLTTFTVWSPSTSMSEKEENDSGKCMSDDEVSVPRNESATLIPYDNLQFAKVSEDIWREATNEMIVMAGLPFDFVESVAWRHFCEKVNMYIPHSRSEATRDIFEIFVKRKKAMRKVFFANKQRVSLTTDILVAPTTEARYMVITAHFIDSNWKLRKVILGVKNVEDHRGSTISSCLLDCLSDWGIEKVFTITVDNTTANTSALSIFTEKFKGLGNEALVLNGDYLQLKCAAHIINSVVRDCLHEVDKSVCSVRNGVHFVRSDTNRLKAFEDKLETENVVGRGSLLLDDKTRWDSTYLMLTRALKFRVGFEDMELEDKLYGPPMKRDWDDIDRLVKFLDVFYHSTLAVSASTKLNAHKCYAKIATIEKNLIRLSKSTDLELQENANRMRAKFDKYWGASSEVNMLLIVASVFDPRHKMQFTQFCFDQLYGKESIVGKGLCDSVKLLMEKMFEEYIIVYAGRCNTGSTSQSKGASSQTSQCHSGQQEQILGDIFDGYITMDDIYEELINNERRLQDPSEELALYLKESVENHKLLMDTDYDVLGWWRDNTPRFPVLSEMARDVLAMQAPSVTSENVFSTSGSILDPYKSALTQSSIEVLMCTEQWLKCEVQLTDEEPVTINDWMEDIELQDRLQREFGL